MTLKKLQRAAVRMFYDEALVHRVYENPSAALMDLSLSQEELAWLVRPDRRRWLSDPARRERSLQVILGEFPVAAGLYVDGLPLSTLQDFFSSPEFHTCINEGLSMVPCFGDWLMTKQPNLASVVVLEQAIARARRRRAVHLTQSLGHWSMCPHVEVAFAVQSALSQYQSHLAKLGSSPSARLDALLTGQALKPFVTADSDESLASFIVEFDPASNDARMSEANPELGQLLEHLRTPRTEKNVYAFLKKFHIDRDQCASILADLASDSLIFQNNS
ncbi:MAG: hypothetical protein VX589_06630 [Myxococcota bacterium]|nr:hypothetical protein [Myxococcota bacterium]